MANQRAWPRVSGEHRMLHRSAVSEYIKIFSKHADNGEKSMRVFERIMSGNVQALAFYYQQKTGSAAFVIKYLMGILSQNL